MYAMTRAGRHLTPAGDLQETFGGMEQVGETQGHDLSTNRKNGTVVKAARINTTFTEPFLRCNSANLLLSLI